MWNRTEFDFESCQEEEDIPFDHSKFQYSGLTIDNLGVDTSFENIKAALKTAKVEVLGDSELSKVGEKNEKSESL